MKVICTQENLNKGIIQVQGIALQSTPLPILKNILIEAKDGFFTLKSTNLEIGITTEIRGKIEKEGQITVDARLLSNFIALLPNENINISTEGKALIIETGLHKTRINGLASDDFPVIPGVKKENGIKLDIKQFKQALLEILPAVSTDDTRAELNGVFFSISDKMMILAGTDSYRLAEKKLQLIENVNFKRSFIVPLKTIKELTRTITGEEASIEVYMEENQVLFKYGATETITRLVEGEYPQYTQIIPSSHNYTFTIAKEDFINSIKIAGLFAAVGTNSVTFTLKPQNKELDILSSTNIGEERTALSINIEGQDEISIVFDYRYLLDGLSSIASEDVVFQATSHSTPVLIKPSDENEQFLYIVMPIRQ